MRLPTAFLLAAFFPAAVLGEEFTGEAYLLGSSVANNGSAGALPSRYATASRYLEFPADIDGAKTFRLEMATLPAFSSLSQTMSGALGYALDARTQISAYGAIVTTPDIPVLPLLRGTRQERLNNPGLRPDPCEGDCPTLKDVVYLANLNFMRKYSGELPRSDISGRPIPLEFSAGATTKYYFEELEGGDYLAQNLNLDLGACLKLRWGYNPITQSSDRDIKLQMGGFELLPTKQKSTFSDAVAYEEMERRWHMSLSWEEGLPAWNSTVALGLTQKSEGGKWPGVGLEWDLRSLLYLRAGMDQEVLAAGASLAYRWLSIHYAFRRHELGNSLYQLSAQAQWP